MFVTAKWERMNNNVVERKVHISLFNPALGSIGDDQRWIIDVDAATLESVSVGEEVTISPVSV